MPDGPQIARATRISGPRAHPARNASLCPNQLRRLPCHNASMRAFCPTEAAGAMAIAALLDDSESAGSDRHRLHPSLSPRKVMAKESGALRPFLEMSPVPSAIPASHRSPRLCAPLSLQPAALSADRQGRPPRLDKNLSELKEPRSRARHPGEAVWHQAGMARARLTLDPFYR